MEGKKHPGKGFSERYSRQLAFERIGKKGQAKLGKATVAVIGLGGLGGMAAELLCRAGIGTLILVDKDKVDVSNLHRQLLYDESDLGKSKVKSAETRLKRMNSSVRLKAFQMSADPNSLQKLPPVDILLDCTDNLKTRFAINDYCIKKGIPWVHAAVQGDFGYLMRIMPGGPCFRCTQKEKKAQNPTTAGIINTLPAIVGAMQANEAIKLVMDSRKDADAYMLLVDIGENRIERIDIEKDASCVCAIKP
jgi:molybdopterin-synthase adenylyltransferase